MAILDPFAFPEVPRWATMWALALSIYAGLKVVTWRTASRRAPSWKHVAYLVGWPGMDANAFLGGAVSRVPSANEWLFAIFKFLFGGVLLLAAITGIDRGDSRLAAWIGMAGVVFLLHFGLFHLLSCLWKTLGCQAAPIMNWPIASQRLAEFWGQRWNLAFRDVTHQFLFQPLRARFRAQAALVCGFFVSGVIHDIVISVPAGGGWGLPTTYFLIQAIGLLGEHSRKGRSIGLGRGVSGRLFCAVTVVAPLPLLFHRVFVDRVMIPFLSTMANWW